MTDRPVEADAERRAGGEPLLPVRIFVANRDRSVDYDQIAREIPADVIAIGEAEDELCGNVPCRPGHAEPSP